ncbi:hypothetical protein BDU57DRAFT_516160 [Ampelomyces quisqualis]|uniref:NYN domain-containing protein n=1 Tax=Ampelomyces quisqualis TaxID=50730 RepID=A0A6A5QNB5_AMPQU|nr:hypothetical protein BDU57DRAFT_516160 [Ampelomyces quisqualis]
MPSQPIDSGWNFSPVFDLIESDAQNVTSPNLRSSEARSSALAGGGVGLGDFGKLFEGLGMRTDIIAPLPPLDESELSNSDDALLSSPILATRPTPVPRNDSNIQSAEMIAKTVLPGTTKKQRRKARREAEKALLQAVTNNEEQAAEAATQTLVELARAEPVEVMLDTPTKPPRARSNVGAKVRPTSPVKSSIATQIPQTPVTRRPVLTNRPKSVVPVTPQAQAQTVLPARDLPMDTFAPHQILFAPQHPPQAITPVGSSLVPRTVRPVTITRQSLPTARHSHIPVTPVPGPVSSVYPAPCRPLITLRSQVDRHFHLFETLVARFPEERKWLVAPRQLVNESTRSEGIHVFVDASNIMIGFKDMLRVSGMQLQDMSFDSLALLMERRRPVAKRCFVGSHREANPLPHIQRLVETCKAVGYECNVQEQVYIAREESVKKKFFNDVNKLGWQKAIQKRSGSGSDSETGITTAPKTPSAPKWVEQGVDELLHLKMCQSLLDTEVPSTVVLATGDGAEAEMSDGFLAHVERALRKGWKVELVTWRQQTNGGYKRKAFRQKWGEQFTITELDEFLEDLIDTP